MNVDGTQSLRLIKPPDQGPHVSAGLASFADEYIRDDLRSMWATEFYPAPEDEGE